ncbi:MAG TPA: cell division protein FtsQ/DivIB, partial [Clostridiales bacterium]|nr:cell division protein FtsQ/DivIB [Clostridiales bacterium]
ASAEKTATASDGGTETASQTEGENTDTASVTVTEKEKEAAKKEIMILTGLTVKEAEPGKQIVLAESTAFDTYREIRDAVQKTDFTGITAMDLRNSNDLRLQYENRIVLKLGTTSGLVKKLEMAKKVLEEQNKISTELTGTIDLTISGRAYFAEGEETDNASESASSTDAAGTETEEKSTARKADSSSAASSAKGSSASG